MTKILFMLFTLFPILSYAHEGHMTANGPFHYLEHSAILFAVIVIAFAVKKAVFERSKK
ncbi:MAG: hypothetical protein K6L76_08840 [Agarilytica sp.]